MGRFFFLIVRLLLEPRVPALLKGLLLLALVYSLVPNTWLPFGPLDNLLLPLGALGLLFVFSPWSVIREHWRRKVEESRRAKGKEVVDVNYRLLDDEDQQS